MTPDPTPAAAPWGIVPHTGKDNETYYAIGPILEPGVCWCGTFEGDHPEIWANDFFEHVREGIARHSFAPKQTVVAHVHEAFAKDGNCAERAALIAVAPEMLALLIAARDMEDPDLACHWLDLARRLIAKAKGGATP